MKNIRYNVYETNSSSSHSISISANTTGILDTIECNDDGVIFITGKYFGRGKYIGMKILDSKKLYFKIVEI